ncbi:MAG: hypothetical protein LAT76_12385 [Schleiferiaceae bacterium]|nr:hypothetical protein [Schleiferiaceae bacterium]
MNKKLLLFAIFINGIVLFGQSGGFIPYYIEVSEINKLPAIPEKKIAALEGLQVKWDTLLPQELMRLGFLKYQSLNDVNLDVKELILAHALGVNIYEYDSEIANAMDILDLKSCDTCSFSVQNASNLQLIDALSLIDQKIRVNQQLYVSTLSTFDKPIFEIVKQRELLKFSNSGYKQFDVLLIYLHAGQYLQEDSTGATQHLWGLLESGELSPYLYAQIIDRWHWDIYGIQLFGSIGNIIDDTYELIAPLLGADSTVLNHRRKAIGLAALEEQLSWEGILNIKYK